MRITDLPSIGKHARGINIRRDVAHVLSQIGTSAERGVDVSDHIAAFQEFMKACALELKRIKHAEKRPLVEQAASAPEQLTLEDL